MQKGRGQKGDSIKLKYRQVWKPKTKYKLLFKVMAGWKKKKKQKIRAAKCHAQQWDETGQH